MSGDEHACAPRVSVCSAATRSTCSWGHDRRARVSKAAAAYVFQHSCGVGAATVYEIVVACRVCNSNKLI